MKPELVGANYHSPLRLGKEVVWYGRTSVEKTRPGAGLVVGT